MAVFLVFILILLFASVWLVKRDADSLGGANDRFAPSGAIVLYSGVGGFVEVVGESNYQGGLQLARARAITIDGRLKFWATIEPENDNPHDENAVVVKFGNEKLGYLRRGDAKTFRASHAGAVSQKVPIAVRALLTGGTKGKPTIGVMLDFWLDTEKTYKSSPVSL